MNAPASPVLTARQQAYVDQYNTLRSAEATARIQVNDLVSIGGVSNNAPNGNFTGKSLTAYEQAQRQHLEAHAKLTNFVMETSTFLGKEAIRYDRMSLNSAYSLSEREFFKTRSAAASDAQGEFIRAGQTQGWQAPADLSYQIGQSRISSQPGGVSTNDSPTWAGSDMYIRFKNGLSEYGRKFNEFLQDQSAAGKQKLQDLKKAGVPIPGSDFELCLLSCGSLKDAILTTIAKSPVSLGGTPRIPLYGETVGDLAYGESISVITKPEVETCRLIFGRGDIKGMLQNMNIYDAELLTLLDSPGINEIAFSVAREVSNNILANDASLQKLSSSTTLQEFDTSLATNQQLVASNAGYQTLIADASKNSAHNTLDGLSTSYASFERRSDDTLLVSTMANGTPVVLVASLDFLDASDTVSEAGTGISFTFETINGTPPANAPLINAAVKDGNFDLRDILGDGDFSPGDFSGSVISGDLAQLIAAADPTNAAGFTPVPVQTDASGNTIPWYQTPEGQSFGQTLTSMQNLAASISGKSSLPLAIDLFNLSASHLRDSGTFGDLANVLGSAGSTLGDLSIWKNFAKAVESGDGIGLFGAPVATRVLQRSAARGQLQATHMCDTSIGNAGHYEFNSTSRRFCAGYLTKKLQEQADNDQDWRGVA